MMSLKDSKSLMLTGTFSVDDFAFKFLISSSKFCLPSKVLSVLVFDILDGNTRGFIQKKKSLVLLDQALWRDHDQFTSAYVRQYLRMSSEIH